MKKTFALLFASTALVGALGLSALAAGDGNDASADSCNAMMCAEHLNNVADPSLLILASNDDDDDDDDDEDDDEDDACGHDGDDARGSGQSDDDDNCATRGAKAAPVGPIVPPANGLFGNGAPPVAVTK